MPEFSLPASIAQAAAGLRAGEFTAVGLVEHCLARISALQPKLNAFITVTGDAALAAARERDSELKRGFDRGPLHGIPVVHKDCFDTAGVLTTVGADVFRNRIPPSNATIVERLAAAGAVMLGKTHMNEFAAGMSGRNAFFGDARNPWNPTRAAGGSSSGSACAIAARLCFGATGTDAGGSIRIPAAWTGIVGLRPTHGLVSTAGVYPRSYSFDCAGPLAARVADVAILLGAMAGEGDYTIEGNTRGIRLGLFSLHGVDDDIGQALTSALAVLSGLGVQIHEIKMPAPDYRVIFDILLYEFHQILGAEYRSTPEREKRFGPVVRANLERGATISLGEYEAALAAREHFIGQLRQAFSSVDAIITPTSPMSAPALEAAESDFDRARQFTLPFSLAGVPALSLPCGFDRAGLPIGMQLVADRLQERQLLRIGAAYEQATASECARSC